MRWFDSLFGNDDGATVTADGDGPNAGRAGDPFGRIVAEPVFDAFRSAWKAGAGLFDLFGSEPVKIKERVGPDAPNRRPDVAKVETFLDRTGHLDLSKTEGPTGYYGSRVDQGIRRFQKDNALKVDGLINPDGETLRRLGAVLSEPEPPSLRNAGFSSMISPSFAKTDAMDHAHGGRSPAPAGPRRRLARKARRFAGRRQQSGCATISAEWHTAHGRRSGSARRTRQACLFGGGHSSWQRDERSERTSALDAGAGQDRADLSKSRRKPPP